MSFLLTKVDVLPDVKDSREYDRSFIGGSIEFDANGYEYTLSREDGWCVMEGVDANDRFNASDKFAVGCDEIPKTITVGNLDGDPYGFEEVGLTLGGDSYVLSPPRRVASDKSTAAQRFACWAGRIGLGGISYIWRPNGDISPEDRLAIGSGCLGSNPEIAIENWIAVLTDSRASVTLKSKAFASLEILCEREYYKRGYREQFLRACRVVVSDPNPDLSLWIKAIRTLYIKRKYGDIKSACVFALRNPDMDYEFHREVIDVVEFYLQGRGPEKVDEFADTSTALLTFAKTSRAPDLSLRAAGYLHARGRREMAIEAYLAIAKDGDRVGSNSQVDAVRRLRDEVKADKSLIIKAARGVMQNPNVLGFSLIEIAQILEDIGEKEAAADAFAAVAGLKGAEPYELVWAARELARFGIHTGAAVLACDRVVGDHESPPAVLLEVGGILTDLGDKEKARRAYERVVPDEYFSQRARSALASL